MLSFPGEATYFEPRALFTTTHLAMRHRDVSSADHIRMFDCACSACRGALGGCRAGLRHKASSLRSVISAAPGAVIDCRIGIERDVKPSKLLLALATMNKARPNFNLPQLTSFFRKMPYYFHPPNGVYPTQAPTPAAAPVQHLWPSRHSKAHVTRLQRSFISTRCSRLVEWSKSLKNVTKTTTGASLHSY